jgi:hypothetical protein
MPVHRIVAIIFRSLKLEAKQADPRNYTLQTFGGVILNDQAPLVVYGLGSLLQNWQLKLVPKPPVRKSTTAIPVSSGPGAPAGSEFPILVVFGDPKFTSKAQRVALSATTRIDTVISKLCEAQKVKHPSKFVIQTLDGVSLQSNFTLEMYGLGKRFKKWELKLVPAKEIDSSTLNTVPEGVKYAWVGVDDTISLLEAKDIIRKLDWALARTSTSAKQSLLEMQDQLRKIVKKNSKIQKKLDRREKELKTQATELASVKAAAEKEKAKPKEKLSLSLAVPAAEGPKSARKSSGEKSPRAKTPRDKTPRDKSPRGSDASDSTTHKKTPAPIVPPRRGTPRHDSQTAASVEEPKADTAPSADPESIETAVSEPLPVVETPASTGDEKTEPAAESGTETAQTETPSSETVADETMKPTETDAHSVGKEVDGNEPATTVEVVEPEKPTEDAPANVDPVSEAPTQDPSMQDTPKADVEDAPASDSAPAAPESAEHHEDGSDSDSDSDSDDDGDDDDDDAEDAAIFAAANATATSLDILEIEQQFAAKHEEAISALRHEYESELKALRAELEELRSHAAPPLSARGRHHHHDREENSASEQSEKSEKESKSESKSEKEKPVVEESIPAAPAPPPPPPVAPQLPEKPAKKEKHSKKDKEPAASSSLPGLTSGGIGTGVLDAISSKSFSLKKVEQPSRKKKGGDDFLRDALEKRFVAMNLDDVEDLDTWDDDVSNTSWNDASAWGDDVMRI